MEENKDPFHKSELTTILVVADIEKSKSFYVELLHAQVVGEYGGTSVVLKFLNNWVLLVTAGGPTEDKPDISFEPPQFSNSVSHSFTIRVENCTQSYKILKNRGVDFITPPHDWGAEIRCFFKDPDGHLFELSEHKPHSAD